MHKLWFGKTQYRRVFCAFLAQPFQRRDNLSGRRVNDALCGAIYEEEQIIEYEVPEAPHRRIRVCAKCRKALTQMQQEMSAVEVSA